MQENKSITTTEFMNANSEDINQKIYSLRDLLMSLKKNFIDWGIGDFGLELLLI